MSNQITITENVTTVEVVSNNPTVLEIEQSNQILVAETGANIPAALGEIRDIDLDVTPTDGQVLTYDEAEAVWRPENGIRRTKTLVVDAAGRGDYTTIKAACDYVATQTPSSSNQWVIQVLPGYYTEAPFSIPTYCLVQGMGQTPTGNVAHCVQISPVVPWTGGTFITMGSIAAIDNCGILLPLDASATADGIGLSGSGRYTRCWFQGINSTVGVRNLKVISGGVVLQDCNVYVGGSNSTAVHCSDGSAIKKCWIYTSAAGTDIFAILMDGHNDDTVISFVRFGATSGNFFNYDIKVTDGRVWVLYSKVKTYTGDVRQLDKWATSLSGLQEAVAATDVVSTLKGAAGQTANLLELKDSADAILASISAAGKISAGALAVGSLSGLLKATSGLVSAASAGVDFENPLTFSTGLTRSINTITADLSTGKSGGQSVIGGIGASENLTIQSSAHATKGKILFGASAYDEVNNRLGIGTNAPAVKLDVKTNAIADIGITTRGIAGQTGNLFEARNSDNILIASISPTGGINGGGGLATGSGNGIIRIDSSGNLVNIGTITSGNINGQTISNAANFAGNLNVVSNLTANRFHQNLNVPTSQLGTPSVTELALFDEQCNNKTEFYDITKLKFYTFDGTAWTEYIVSDAEKKKFVGGDSSALVNIPNGTQKFRIEVTNSGTYVFLNTLYMWWSAQGHTTQVHIWQRNFSTQEWSQVAASTTSISGWPAHLYLPFTYMPFANNKHSDCIRIEFIPTWSPTYSSNPIELYRMQIWGGYPAGKRNIYSTDAYKSVTFPSNILTSASVGVGTINAPIAQLEVKLSAATKIGIAVRGFSGQTGNLFEARNSSDAILAYIDAAGIVKAAGYKSSDASEGLTQTVTVRNAAGDGTTTLTFKNGLLTGVA